ncbi:MAG: pyruvate, phosphate dikinase, partial [Phycisphaerae bacterium]|nr:pyruvate, phosphate dikinase [Phycisphaerae bacterium]
MATKPTTTRSRSRKRVSGRGMISHFGQHRTDGDATQRERLGGKGANLAEMSSIGLPVPPGFTITTDVCEAYEQAGGKLPSNLMDSVREHVELLEKETGKDFGSAKNPLLVSVRSGAAVSMPGMMDTVLNLGLNDAVVPGLAASTGDERFAWDAYRRLINMFGDVVMGVDHHLFEAEFDRIKKKYRVEADT